LVPQLDAPDRDATAVALTLAELMPKMFPKNVGTALLTTTLIWLVVGKVGAGTVAPGMFAAA